MFDSFETFTFILRTASMNAIICVGVGGFQFSFTGSRSSTEAKIEFAVTALKTDAFALRTELLAEVEQVTSPVL